MTTVGVLALQGDFLEHEAVLRCLDVDAVQVRTSETMRDLDGRVIPGGESTTLCRLMEEYQLYEPLRGLLRSGLPTWGTCAGMILLAQRVNGLDFPTLEALDVTVERNAYGRQVDSFEADLSVPILGELRFPAVFIRAPVVTDVGAGIEVLARLPAPDGSGGTDPLRADRLTTSGDMLFVSWDNSTCSAADYNLLYGDLSGVNTLALSGSECSLGAGGSFSWNSVPAGNLFFLVVGTDGSGIESSWGLDGNDGERNGLTVSGECSTTFKEPSNTCP